MDKRTCVCRSWELTAIPCVHAVAAIIEQNEDPFSYVDQCYSKTVYQQVYSHLINPTNGPELWEAHPSPPGIFLPPHGNKKKRGRMPTARKKEAEELEKRSQKSKSKQKLSLKKKGIVKVQCSICGKIGHNKRYHGVSPTMGPATTVSYTCLNAILL